MTGSIHKFQILEVCWRKWEEENYMVPQLSQSSVVKSATLLALVNMFLKSTWVMRLMMDENEPIMAIANNQMVYKKGGWGKGLGFEQRAGKARRWRETLRKHFGLAQSHSRCSISAYFIYPFPINANWRFSQSLCIVKLRKLNYLDYYKM